MLDPASVDRADADSSSIIDMSFDSSDAPLMKLPSPSGSVGRCIDFRVQLSPSS